MRISDWSSDVCSSDLKLVWKYFYANIPEQHLAPRIMALQSESSAGNRATGMGSGLRVGFVILQDKLSIDQYPHLITVHADMLRIPLFIDHRTRIHMHHTINASQSRSEERSVGKKWVRQS